MFKKRQFGNTYVGTTPDKKRFSLRTQRKFEKVREFKPKRNFYKPLVVTFVEYRDKSVAKCFDDWAKMVAGESNCNTPTDEEQQEHYKGVCVDAGVPEEFLEDKVVTSASMELPNNATDEPQHMPLYYFHADKGPTNEKDQE